MANESHQGRAPEGHPRRCQGYNWFKAQCGRWAMRGSNYCPKHGGRRKRICGYMGQHYSRHAGAKLKTILQQLQEDRPDERLSLEDEVDLARATTLRSIKLWEAAEESDNDEARGLATALVRDSINHVSNVVKNAAQVSALTKQTIKVGDVGYVIAQVTRILEDELGGSDAGKLVLDRITKRFDELRLPEHEEAPPVLIIQ